MMQIAQRLSIFMAKNYYRKKMHKYENVCMFVSLSKISYYVCISKLDLHT